MMIMAVPIAMMYPSFSFGIFDRKMIKEQYSINMNMLDSLCQLSAGRNTY